MPQNNIVEMKSYKEKRRAFLITLKEEIEPNQEAKPKGAIQIIDIKKKIYSEKIS